MTDPDHALERLRRSKAEHDQRRKREADEKVAREKAQAEEPARARVEGKNWAEEAASYETLGYLEKCRANEAPATPRDLHLYDVRNIVGEYMKERSLNELNLDAVEAFYKSAMEVWDRVKGGL